KNQTNDNYNIEPFYIELHVLCNYYEVKKFVGESNSLCCNNRKIVLTYNALFAFTSMDVHLDQQLANKHELKNQLCIMLNLYSEIIESIKNILNEVNPFVANFWHLSTLNNIYNYRLIIKADHRLDQHIYNAPIASQVATIWIEGNDSNKSQKRDIIHSSILTASTNNEQNEGDFFNNTLSELYSGLADSFNTRNTNTANIGKQIILPSSFTRQFHMPYVLRNLFSAILVFRESENLKKLWNENFQAMSEDFTMNGIPEGQLHINAVLKYINQFLQQHNKKELSISIKSKDLTKIQTLNETQKNIFNIVINYVDNNRSGIFFIDRLGGSRKTYLYKCILAIIRSLGFIALATASSGIASLIMPGGHITYSRFKIPIPIDTNSSYTFSKQSQVGQLLLLVKLIIWDKSSMTHRHAIEALDRSLKDITRNNYPFGSKIIIFVDDFRQVLPVVQQGTRTQIVNASFNKSPLWLNIKVFHLSDNMRANNNNDFMNFLLRIGNSTEPIVKEDIIRISDQMTISWQDNHEKSLEKLIQYIYPELSKNIYNTSYIIDRAILTTKNEYVNYINEKVIKQFNENFKIYYSYNSVLNNTNNIYQTEFINSLTSNELLTYQLTLKVNAPIISVGEHHDKRVFLSRIPMMLFENFKMPFILKRKQFPVRLVFVLTINKLQEQTIPHVGLYLLEH
ncbi:589_t:CDS:2, partial [Scutellospora calospora]